MSDITSYSNSAPVVASNRFLGSDSSGSTKNFLASDLASYINGTAPGTVTTTTSTSYTLVITDSSIVASAGSATGITVPPNSSVAFPIGTTIPVMNGLSVSANVTVSPGSGVTIRYSSSNNVFGQYSSRTLKKVAADTWFLY